MRFGLIVFMLTLLSASAWADAVEMHVTLQDQTFTPNTINVPADKKVTLIIHNNDAVAAEFESYELHREKLVPAGKEVALNLTPMKAGSYKFYNDLHRSTTGTLVVK